MKHILFLVAKVRIYLHISKSNRRSVRFHRRTATKPNDRPPAEAHPLNRACRKVFIPMKNTSRGVWGHGNECPQKKSVPTFGLRGGLGGGECRPPIENSARLSGLPIRALQGGRKWIQETCALNYTPAWIFAPSPYRERAFPPELRPLSSNVDYDKSPIEIYP